MIFYDLEIYQYLVGNVNQSVSAQNYVKRFSHHTQVVKELLSFVSEKEVSDPVRNYLDKRMILLLNTHYNIALIYNENRKEGLTWGREFRKYLKSVSRKYYKATSKRYAQAKLLHYFGVDYECLNRLKGRS